MSSLLFCGELEIITESWMCSSSMLNLIMVFHGDFLGCRYLVIQVA